MFYWNRVLFKNLFLPRFWDNGAQILLQNTEPLVNSLNSCISTTTFGCTVNKVTVYVKRIQVQRSTSFTKLFFFFSKLVTPKVFCKIGLSWRGLWDTRFVIINLFLINHMISFLKHGLEIEIGYVFNFLVIQNLNYRASFLDYVVNFDGRPTVWFTINRLLQRSLNINLIINCY